MAASQADSARRLAAAQEAISLFLAISLFWRKSEIGKVKSGGGGGGISLFQEKVKYGGGGTVAVTLS